MRFVLLLALLLRLLPTPAHAAEGAHCVVTGEVAAAVEHAGHHAPAPAPTGDFHADADHDDCPHCPPADCATQVHCSAPSLVSLAADTPQHADLVTIGRSAAARAEHWPTRHHQPPVRPPLPLA